MRYNTRTRVFPVDPDHPAPGIIAAAANAIRDGRLVAFPTETVYGLGADATRIEAVGRIFAAKQRPTTDPIIVHIAAIEQLDQVAVEIPMLARQLADRFWAGALTMILKRSDRIPSIVSAGRETVAVRMPSHPVAKALIEAAGVPIAAPSANTFSRPSATTAAHVLDDLDGHVDVILDGGAARIGLESTVIDLTLDAPTVLRPGGVTLEALRSMIPDLQTRERYIDAESGEAAASPGEMLKHYAPNARLMLIDGDANAANMRIRQLAAEFSANGERVGILAPDEEIALFAESRSVVIGIGSRDDLAQIGVGLFGSIRRIDAKNVEVILIRSLPREGLGAAIWDRLVRAAEGRVIYV